MYSPEEIQGAVEKLVRGSIRRPTDTLGVRRPDVSFSDIQEAAAGVFLLYPKAPFYVAYLAAQRLKDAAVAEHALVAAILRAIDDAGRPAAPVEDVASLFDAKAALEELEGASAARAGAFSAIAKVPAFQRFDASAQAFLDGPASRLRASGSLARTPEEARASLPPLLAELKEAHSSLRRGVTLLASAIVDYERVQLPALVAQGVVRRARDLIADHASRLDAMAKEERPRALRAAALDVLASRAIVRTFGSLGGGTNALFLQGTGEAFADATHLGSTALLISDAKDALALLAGANSLELLVDRNPAPVMFALPLSTVAALEGTASESDGTPPGFRIHGNSTGPAGDATVPKNNVLAVEVTTSGGGAGTTTTYRATLTPSSGSALRSAQSVCDELNLALPPSLRARPVFFPLRYAGPVDLEPHGSLAALRTVGGGAADFAAFGAAVGDVARLVEGANAGLYPITAVAPGELTVARSAGTFTRELAARAEIGPKARRVRLEMIDPLAQVPARASVAVRALDPVTQATAGTLGFFPGLVSRCEPVRVERIAEGISIQTARAKASAVFEPRAVAQGRVRATTPRAVSVFATTGDADVALADETVTLSGAFPSPLPRAGDIVVLRSGPRAGLAAAVTSASSTRLVARSIAAGPIAAGALSRTSFDVGPDVGAHEGETLRVFDGPLAGDYVVDGAGATPLDIAVKAAVPVLTPLPVVFACALGSKRVQIEGLARTPSAEIVARGSAAGLLFPSSPGAARGTTPFVRLPAFPRGLAAGDVLERYASDAGPPTETFVIQDVEATGVVRVTPDVPLGTTFAFGVDSPPFARLRATVTADFVALEARLRAWLAHPANGDAGLAKLDRALNPIVASTSPSPFALGQAKAAFEPLAGLLTRDGALAFSADAGASLEDTLRAYAVDPVPPVDTLLQTFREKGSDRATDLLLQCAFRTFFGLTQEEASYAGAVQSAMRDVAQTDMPLKTSGRTGNARRGTAIAAETPDYEFDRSDVETGADVDPPESPG